MPKRITQKDVHSSVMVLVVALIVLRDLLVSNIYYFPPIPMLHLNVLELLAIGQLWVVYHCRKRQTTMEKLIIFYAAWVILSRFLLRDFAEDISPEILMACEMCVAFCAMCSMNRKAASHVFALVTAILCAILTVGSICGLVVVLSDVSEIRLMNNIAIRIGTEYFETAPGEMGILRFLDFFPIHRNESSAWMMVGLWLLAYQWTTCKKKLWRIPMAFSMLLMYISVALQRSRCVSVCVGFSIGLLVASTLLKLNWKKLPTYFVMAVTVALCAFVVYKSFTAINTGLVKLSTVLSEITTVADTPLTTDELPTEVLQPEAIDVTEDIPEITDSAIVENIPEFAESVDVTEDTLEITDFIAIENEPETTDSAAAEEPVLTDQRNFLRDFMTLTLRTRIWGSELLTLGRDPVLLAFGQREADVAENMIRYGGLDIPAAHTHNAFLQVLAMYGVPGVILLGAFLLLVLWKMLRVYFGNFPISVKILTFPLFGLFLDGVMEPMFTARIGLATACFMLIAGMLCREDAASK